MSLLLTVNILLTYLNFFLIIEFEQANVCWVRFEKKNTFEDKIEYIMNYVAVF